MPAQQLPQTQEFSIPGCILQVYRTSVSLLASSYQLTTIRPLLPQPTLAVSSIMTASKTHSLWIPSGKHITVLAHLRDSHTQRGQIKHKSLLIPDL